MDRGSGVRSTWRARSASGAASAGDDVVGGSVGLTLPSSPHAMSSLDSRLQASNPDHDKPIPAAIAISVCRSSVPVAVACGRMRTARIGLPLRRHVRPANPNRHARMFVPSSSLHGSPSQQSRPLVIHIQTEPPAPLNLIEAARSPSGSPAARAPFSRGQRSGMDRGGAGGPGGLGSWAMMFAPGGADGLGVFAQWVVFVQWMRLFWANVLPNVLDVTDVVKSVRQHQEQIEQARTLHRQELKASLAIHNHDLDYSTKLHNTEVKLQCRLHDKEKEMSLATHNIALQVELLHASCENIRDTAEQYIAKISTFLLIETLLLGSLFVVIIEAELPTNMQHEMSWLVFVYALTAGLSFLTLSAAVYLTYAVQERVLKLRRHALSGAFKAFKEHREHWTQSITKLRDFYFRLESEREHLHAFFDEDIQQTKALVQHGSVCFACGIFSLGCAVATVMFAKLTLSFSHPTTGDTQHAWGAAYLFLVLFVASIVVLIGLLLREQGADVLRPVILLSGDYCLLVRAGEVFSDPGASAKDLKDEGGAENDLTDWVEISVCFHTKAHDEPVILGGAGVGQEAQHARRDGGPAFVVKAHVDDAPVPSSPRAGASHARAREGSVDWGGGAGGRLARLVGWIPRKPGMYVITYQVSDEKGNVGRASRTVIASPAEGSRSDMVVPPSTPPSKLYLHETKRRRKQSLWNVEMSGRPGSYEDLDGLTGVGAAGAMAASERAANDLHQQHRSAPTHLRMNNLAGSSNDLSAMDRLDGSGSSQN